MYGFFSLLRNCQNAVIGFALATVLTGADPQAAEVTVSLNALADLTSNFNTYSSDGIAQLDLTYPGTTRQPFWNTNDLSQTYNANFDFFPNDREMRFGELTYDDSSLVSGSGAATVTSLTLGVEIDPLDPNYVNGSWLGFSTDLGTYSGTVTVLNGALTGINLTAGYTSIGYFGPAAIEGEGTFTIVGDQFQVAATAYSPLGGPDNPSMEWDWTGTILAAVSEPFPGDYDLDDDVDGNDFLLWQRNPSIGDLADWRANFGAGSLSASSLAAIPEPTGTLLMTPALAAATALRARRRRCVPL